MAPGSHSSHGTHRGSHSSHGTHWGPCSSHGTWWAVVSTSVLGASAKISLAVMSVGGQIPVNPYSCCRILKVMFFTWNPSGLMFLHGNHRGSHSSHGTYRGSHSSHGTHRGSHSSHGTPRGSLSSHDPIWGHILPMIQKCYKKVNYFVIWQPCVVESLLIIHGGKADMQTRAACTGSRKILYHHQSNTSCVLLDSV